MNKFKTTCALALMAAVCAPSASAKEEVADSLVQKYMRSSLYTIILNSDTMNQFYEEETKKGENADELMSMVKGFAKTDEKKAANDSVEGSLFALPAQVFPTIEIPNQFNDHNLAWRVVDFDSIKATVTEEELAKYAPAKKKGGFGKFAKSMAGMETKGDDNNAAFDKYAPAVINKFFNSNNVAPSLIAKWYDYTPDGEQHWGMATLTDRGNYNFTPDDLQKAAEDFNLRAKIEQTAFDMISNTYVMAVNLRFRSYQAVVAEAAALAKGVGSQFGGIGALAAQAASTAASAAAGDGYTVQAVSHLYRLKWNDDINQQFAVDIFGKNATVEDLINSGICELEFVGTEKASSNIRQSLLSSAPMSSLVKRATARAIDEAIIKLQNSHEEFRTVLPIIGGDGENLYAAIGTKEGLTEKDEYEILEAQEDEKGKRTYKSVGTVKAVPGTIWNNAYGAEEEINSDPKASEADKAALSYGYTQFKGKKGDFRGYYLRLKKKK